MKKSLYLMLLIGTCSLSLTNCDGTPTTSENSSSLPSETPSFDVSSPLASDSVDSSSDEEVVEKTNDILLAEDYSNCVSLENVHSDITHFDNSFLDNKHFSSKAKVSYEETYKNNVKTNVTSIGNDDVKYLFYSTDHARLVSNADGYAITIPTTTTLQADFSLGEYRSKVYNADLTLTVSYEHSNPYNGWKTYREEWLFRYLDEENYYSQNNLSKLCESKISDSNFLKGYIVDQYDLVINNPGQIQKYYYHIAAIRKSSSVKDFFLLVLKSTFDMSKEFEEMILSFKEVKKSGTANNKSIYNLPVSTNVNWNDETKEYYNQILTSNRTGWGAFTATLPEGTKVESVLKVSNAYKKLNALSEAVDYQFDILPTYQHIAWGRNAKFSWPKSAANFMAGGNGKNGKPVIQMSYQFTDNNNNVSVANKADCYTPMFDIYRGNDGTDNYYGQTASPQNKYELAMRYLAEEIKEYSHPVLFRLNNEMNTDWTSYCGMMTLLDPDIFQATWRVIYNIFEEVGVDNCIWIFNPVAITCPYCSWGEDMCYYPGLQYVQALGLTSYEDNNNNNVNESTFRRDYTVLYNKNNDVWNKYPWIISEFGCGSGGDASGKLYRNQASQVKYINGMFNDFNDRENNPYLQNIKGAVWFSVNDSSDGKVVNQYELVIDQLKDTIAALKAGLAKNKLA